MKRTTFAALAALLVTPAQAHDWYPMECCHALDCAPVDKVEHGLVPTSSLPSMTVTTKHGTVVVPSNQTIRESKDNQMHACMRPDGNGGMRLLCIFMPPGM